MKALVLAAGFGSRIAAVARQVPKPLLEVDGAPVLVHNLRLLKKHGVREVWINLHYRPAAIRKAIGNGRKWGVQVRYSLERKILGTAGAVKKLARRFHDGTFLVLYGDNYTDCDLKELCRTHRSKKAIATLAVFHETKNRNSRIAGGRIEIKPGGEVAGFTEGNAARRKRSPFVNAGIYALEPEILDQIPFGFSDFGRDIFPALLARRARLAAYRMKGFCFAVDTPEALRNTLRSSRAHAS